MIGTAVDGDLVLADERFPRNLSLSVYQNG